MKDDHREWYKLMGKRIKLIREIHDMSQKELGSILDIDQNHVSRIETARVGISLDMLFEIAKAFDIEPSEILDFSSVRKNK